MLTPRLVIKDVLLDHAPTHLHDRIDCSCGKALDVDHDQYIDHLMPDLMVAIETQRNPNAPTGQSTRRHWTTI